MIIDNLFIKAAQDVIEKRFDGSDIGKIKGNKTWIKRNVNFENVVFVISQLKLHHIKILVSTPIIMG